MTLYSLAELARATKVSDKTLRTWRDKGWLRPTAMVGSDRRYSMAAFEAACEASLEVGADLQQTRRVRGWARSIATEYTGGAR